MNHSRLNSTMMDLFRRTATNPITSLALLACCLDGCISRPPLDDQTFTFDTPAAPVANVDSRGRVLGIKTLRVAVPFDGCSFVYRTGDFSYVRDPYAEFLEPPDESLIVPIREWLGRDGDFGAVVEPRSALKPDTLVQISVNELFGDFRQPKSPAAVMTIQFTFLDALNGVPGKAIFQQEYTRSIPLSASTPGELIKGWNQALAEILSSVSSDIRQSEAAGSTGSL